MSDTEKLSPSGIGELTEEAFCEKCQLSITREREYISEDTEYQYDKYRTDEREEYVCSYCYESHALTIPTEEFNSRQSGELHSYEQITIDCRCGREVSVPQGSLPIQTGCECGREYEFKQ